MMNPGRSVILFLLTTCSLLTVACATENTGADATTSTPQQTQTDETSSALANTISGVQKDTLQACVKRIPSDATAGQRMLAEQSCQRDEATRKQYPYREALP
jgi:hypothetical protein